MIKYEIRTIIMQYHNHSCIIIHHHNRISLTYVITGRYCGPLLSDYEHFYGSKDQDNIITMSKIS